MVSRLIILKKKNENKRLSHSYEKLPVPKRKKSSLIGRVGAANEAGKRAQLIDIKKETSKENGLIEDIVNINENMHYDIPTSEKKLNALSQAWCTKYVSCCFANACNSLVRIM